MTDVSFAPRRALLALLLGAVVAATTLSASAAASSTPIKRATEASTSKADIATAADELVRAAGDHRLLLIGEMHGTREVPQLAAALVDRYSMTQPVVLGLELGRNGHSAIAAYLQSKGSAADRQALRDQQFLYSPPGENDGRRNESVLDLIESLRQMRKAGRDVAVLPFDVTRLGSDADARDQVMAGYLHNAFDALPRGRLIVVTGNVHAIKARPDVPEAAEFPTSMGSFLLDLDPYAINVDARFGHFWACMPDCGEQTVQLSTSESGPSHGPTRSSFDYELVLPAFSTPVLIVQTPAK